MRRQAGEEVAVGGERRTGGGALHRQRTASALATAAVKAAANVGAAARVAAMGRQGKKFWDEPRGRQQTPGRGTSCRVSTWGRKRLLYPEGSVVTAENCSEEGGGSEGARNNIRAPRSYLSF